MRIILLMLATLGIAAAAGVSGKWTIQGDVQGHEVNLNCTVQQDAEAKLTGKCTINGGESVDIAGDAKGEQFKFSFTAGGYTLDYSGTVQNDTMKGGIEVSGASGTFTGKRTAE